MNVMQPFYPDDKWTQAPFKIAAQDPNNTATSCEFWNDMAAERMKVVGESHHEPSLTIQDAESLPELELKH